MNITNGRKKKTSTTWYLIKEYISLEELLKCFFFFTHQIEKISLKSFRFFTEVWVFWGLLQCHLHVKVARPFLHFIPHQSQDYTFSTSNFILVKQLTVYRTKQIHIFQACSCDHLKHRGKMGRPPFSLAQIMISLK